MLNVRHCRCMRFFILVLFSLRGNAAACVCAALPLNETHTIFSRTHELDLVAIRASLKQHRHAVIDCLCMKPLRSLECNCKDLVWPLYGPLEGSWKTFGRPLEGPWKTIERPMYGHWKALDRNKSDHCMHVIIEAAAIITFNSGLQCSTERS